jgi:hypothetical protein
MLYAKNRRARLERHVKRNPNDVQSVNALKHVSSEYKARPGDKGPFVKTGGYQIVSFEKRKGRDGKMRDVPMWKNLDGDYSTQLSNALKSAKVGQFFRLENRAAITVAGSPATVKELKTYL